MPACSVILTPLVADGATGQGGGVVGVAKHTFAYVCGSVCVVLFFWFIGLIQ